LTKPQCCRKTQGFIDRKRIKRFDNLKEKLIKKDDHIAARTRRLNRPHGLCGSNKLLYKRCAKSIGRPKFRSFTAFTFSTDFNETQNQERYPGYDPTCKIWLMWDVCQISHKSLQKHAHTVRRPSPTCFDISCNICSTTKSTKMK